MKNRLLRYIHIMSISFFWLLSAQMSGYGQNPVSPADSANLQTATITGKITHAENGEPVPFANVFLNNSLLGTITNEQGFYTLQQIPFGNVELLVSYVGFLPQKRLLRIESSEILTVNITLSPAEQVLAEVQVQARQDKDWQRQYKRFEKNLFGQSSNAPYCKILNPWVLEFKEKDNTLTATASQPLEIENKAIGYKIVYYLKQFELGKGGALYVGETKFEELVPAGSREENRWKRNRLEAYKGSMRHFFKSLMNNTWEEEGFLAYKVDQEQGESIRNMHSFLSDQVGRNLSKLVPSKVLFPGRVSFERRMVFTGKIEIIYTKGTDRHSPYKDVPYQTTRIKVRKSFIELNTNGQAYDPTSYEITGYLVKEGIADILPQEYSPEETSGSQIAQAQNSVSTISYLDTLTTKFMRSTALRFQQKIYLHLDKSFYVSGEILWYSVYLLESSQNGLYAGSQILYVDLISPAQTLIKQSKVKVIDGRAAGDFLLPKTLATGTYRIRAYTNWMRNFDPDYFFDIPLEIYHIEQRTTTELAVTATSQAANPVSVQFFPEGGNLVDGIASRIGFKAISAEGRGIMVKGSIQDENNQRILSFESNPLGMGSFHFKPLPGHTYTAFYESAGGMIQAVLPKALPQGITMGVSEPDSSIIQLKILSSAEYTNEEVYVIGQSRGVIYHSATEKLSNGVAFIDIPKSGFPNGVCQLTLFNSKGIPQCERLIFISHADSELLVQVQPTDTVYEAREKVAVTISITDASASPQPATFSIAVLDAGQIAEDSTQGNILTYLLLTSDLKGYIENPAYYFAGNRVAQREDLDNLLLTQGWRRFSWEKILSGKEVPLTYPVEKGLTVQGKAVTGIKNKPLTLSRITLIPLDSLYSSPQDIATSPDGRFQSAMYDFIDSTKVVYQVTNKKGKLLDATLILDSLKVTGISKPVYPLLPVQPTSNTLTYLHQARIRSKIDSTYAGPQTKVLKEVVIEGKRITQTPPEYRGMTRLYGEPDDVLMVDENLSMFSNIYELIAGRFAGVQVSRSKDARSSNGYQIRIRGVNSFTSSTQPLFLLDGLPIEDPEGTALLSFSPADIARIEVIKNEGASMFGVRGGNGVIALYTRKGPRKTNISSTAGLKSFVVTGFQYPKEFYSPAYDVEKDEHIRPDRRATLYWNPLIYTDENGKIQLSFFNSDTARKLQFIIEGISVSGQPFIYRQQFGKD